MKLSTLKRAVVAVTAIILTFILILTWMLQEFGSSNHNHRFKRIRNSGRIIMNAHHVAPLKFRVRQHGSYWILYDYIAPERTPYGLNDSVTLTTHGDFSYLEILGPLLKRWRQPISVAIFASGSDFDIALNSIRYLHDCTNFTGYMMDMFVSFHFVIHENHLPAYIPKTKEEIFDVSFNCLDEAPFNSDSTLYRHQHALEYPVNLLRNVARLSAQTYYVFPLPIQLFPTPTFVMDFLHMVRSLKLKNPQRTVFCLPVFEVSRGIFMPVTKSELKTCLRDNIVVPFHGFDAAKNEVPNQSSWLLSADPRRMQVFQITKRVRKWEPWCVTINKVEPLHDERFSWGSMYEKPIQSQLLEALDYDFAVLDGAFLVQYTTKKLFQQYNYDNAKIATKLSNDKQKAYKKQLLTLYVDTKQPPEAKGSVDLPTTKAAKEIKLEA